MNEFQFLETLYHKEHERRSEILTSLNLTLLVLSALVTGMFYLITTFVYGLPVWRTATFVCLILLAAIGLFIALFYLIGAMNNFLRAFEYKGLPRMTKQFEWKEELINNQGKKCCYCEKSIDTGDLEHYRPKQGWKQNKGTAITRPGYYWLSYRWKNLLLSCKILNP